MNFLLNSLVLKKIQIQGYSIYIYVVFGNTPMCLMQSLKIVYLKHFMYLIHDTYLG